MRRSGRLRGASAAALAALVAGALLRIAILPLAVPSVDDSWRAWSYAGATQGPAHIYGPRGHTVKFAGIDAPVVYPPLALYEMALIGRTYMVASRGRFPNDVGLTVTIKGAIVLLDAALTALVFAVVHRLGGRRAAWWAASMYWLNPAVLMTTTLGYVDVFFALPAVGAVIAASSGRPWVAGALFTAAVMTKPQGLFVAPAIALALWNAGDLSAARRRLAAATTASALVAALLTAPIVVAGTTLHMLRSVAVLAGHNMLSALACNLWWIVSYAFEAATAAEHGLRAALLARPAILSHAEVMERGFPNPRLIAAVLLGGAVLWALRVAFRARDLGIHAAVAAFVVVAYFTLSVQVHENHFFLALPFLAIAAALRREFAPVFATLSVTFALNLYLFFGVTGDGPPERLLRVAGLDSTLLLSVVNCAALGWFAATFRRVCQEGRDCGAGAEAGAAKSSGSVRLQADH